MSSFTLTAGKAILERARDLIEQKGWTQNTLAKDKMGYMIDPDSPDAACFCLLGAMIASEAQLWSEKVYKDQKELNWAVNNAFFHLDRTMSTHEKIPCDIIPRRVALSNWQDQEKRTKQEVLSLFHEAINTIDRLEMPPVHE